MRAKPISLAAAILATMAMTVSTAAIAPTSYALDAEATDDTGTSLVNDDNSTANDDRTAINNSDGTTIDDSASTDNTGDAGDDANTSGDNTDIPEGTDDIIPDIDVLDTPDTTDDSDGTASNDADGGAANQDDTDDGNTEEVADNAVYVDGVYHDEAFDDGSVKLEYGEDGKPTLTLTDTTLTQPSEFTADEYGTGAAVIHSAGDLTIRLKGTNTITVDGTAMTNAIYVGGNLTIIGDSSDGTSALNINANNTSANIYSFLLILAIGDLSTQQATLDMTYDGDDYAPTYALASFGDITMANSTLAGKGLRFGLVAEGGATVTDSTLTSTDGEMSSMLLATKDATIAGNSTVDVTYAQGRWSAIHSRKTLTIDLQGSGSIHLQEAGSDTGWYALLAGERLVLGAHTAVNDPAGASIGRVEDYRANPMTLLDADGNAVSNVTLKASEEETEPLVGTTFMYEGFEYTITNNDEDNGTATLTGVDPDASKHRLYDYPDLTWGTDRRFFAVTDVQQGALTEMTGTLTLATLGSTELCNLAFSNSSIGEEVTIELLVYYDVTITESGFATDYATVNLPSGHRFDRINAYYIGWGTITNESGATVSVTIFDYESDQPLDDLRNPIQVADNESLDIRVLAPNLASIEFNLMYQVVGSEEGWQPLPITRDNFSDYYSGILFVTLPDSVPADATVNLSFQDYLDKKQGYISSSWDESRAITLTRGRAMDTVTFASNFADLDLALDYAIRITTEGSGDADNSVYINGVYHDEAFTSDDGSVSLTYVDDKPVLTLDKATLTVLGAPVLDKSNAAIIRSATDLTIRLKGDSTISSTSIATTSSAISVNGDLTIIADSTDTAPTLTIRETVSTAVIPHLIEANDITIQQVTLDMTYDGNGEARALYAGGSITVTDSTITMGSSTLAGEGIYSGLFALADITVTDSALNATDGKMDSLIRSEWGNVTVSGNSQVEMSHGGEYHFSMAIFARHTLTFDLQESGFVHIKATHPDVNPYAISAYKGDIVLGENTEISDPEGAIVKRITAGGATHMALLDANDNIVSNVTIKAKAATEPEQPGGTEQPEQPGGTEQPEQPGGTEQPEQPGGSDAGHGNDNQASGDKLANSGSETVPFVTTALTLALLGLCAALAAGTARRSRGTHNGRSRQ
ncbi:beta-N-hexosaminidase [Bifidobacterium lemurum]|uniref:Beta-N-hexosaminidase n=1 Tax=Bifidobacterium lemurum TaxID=1603886 RepID=A0A261FP28_9BIFI|nr:hypothetical protein [Bifidobacterium lemurum]OZG60922.1 beta-N-hexosaminidase [Bifidobacterium lemurum]QOL35003.1 hypothetical protein BL8807_03755 [Bifidobacterium lemurum]